MQEQQIGQGRETGFPPQTIQKKRAHEELETWQQVYGPGGTPSIVRTVESVQARTASLGFEVILQLEWEWPG